MKQKTNENLQAILKKYIRFLIIGGILVFVFSLSKSGYRIYSSQSQVEEAKEKVDSLKVEHKRLESELKKAQSASYVERQIRDKLQMAKENEVVLVLPDTDVLRQLAPIREPQVEQLPDPNWKKWMKLFIGEV